MTKENFLVYEGVYGRLSVRGYNNSDEYKVVFGELMRLLNLDEEGLEKRIKQTDLSVDVALEFAINYNNALNNDLPLPTTPNSDSIAEFLDRTD